MRAWALALTPVVLLAALLAAMFLWLDRNEVPPGEPPVTPFASGQPIRPPHSLIQVQPVPSEPDPPLASDLRAGDVVVDQTLLGTHEAYTFYGVLTEADEVCAVPRWVAANSGAPTHCIDWATFQAQGMVYNQGVWGFDWQPDGSIKWFGT